jgi:hypothetical protein
MRTRIRGLVILLPYGFEFNDFRGSSGVPDTLKEIRSQEVYCKNTVWDTTFSQDGVCHPGAQQTPLS